MTASWDYARIRPPTEAYTDRVAAATWRESVMPGTAWPGPAMRTLILEGIGALDLGAATEMFLPVMRGLASRAYGDQFAFAVVTPNQDVTQFLHALAADHDAPVFLASSIHETPRALRPAGTLTSAEAETLDTLISLGGSTTAAALAEKRGLEPAAANNRLASLARKGFLLRYSRNRREGDLYVDPGTRSAAVSFDTTNYPPHRAGELQLPAEVEETLRALAEETNRSPGELLAEAWRTYFDSHLDELKADVRAARRQIDEPSENAAESVEPEISDWAEAAAARLRPGG